MKLLIDVNLSPAWVAYLSAAGVDCVHWTTIGDPRASDDELLLYARAQGLVVFTHDLDFGALLALTRAVGPSVLQVRAQNVLPDAMGPLVLRVLRAHGAALEAGALVTADEATARIRILPIR